MFLHMSPPVVVGWYSARQARSSRNGVGPVVLPKTRNAPELSQRLQGSGRDSTTHIRTLPAEVLQHPGHYRLGPASFPQKNMVGGPPGQERMHHEVAAHAVNALTNAMLGCAACSRSISDSFGPVNSEAPRLPAGRR